MDTRETNRFGWTMSIFTARWVLGLIFFMAGWWKCFTLTPVGHARKYFLEWFKDEWIPQWLLWGLGVSIPVVELVAGGLVCLGLFRRAAYVALAAILVTVTYGHLLIDPLFDTTSHILPRLILLVFVWVSPAENDRFSLDPLLRRMLARGSPAEA